MNAWLLLILAGLCEIGWPLGLKWAQSGLWRLPGFIMAGVCMLVSGALLFMAQKHIPIGTAYAVWTGIGAAGTFLAGALLLATPYSRCGLRASRSSSRAWPCSNWPECRHMEWTGKGRTPEGTGCPASGRGPAR